ncbi:hypothetical protein ACS0TY_007509 [Phlomoides rotata]
MLAWSLIHGKLSTWNFNRRRGVSGPSQCCLCHNVEEGIGHIFSHCPWTQHIISKVTDVFNVHFNYDHEFCHWILQAISKKFSPQVKPVLRLCIITIVWLIWDQRNKCVFDNGQVSFTHTLASFWAMIREANSGNLGHMFNNVTNLSILTACAIVGHPSKVPTINCILWQRPPNQIIKINVDGGAAGAPGTLTGGGVFRDNFGVFRGCFSMTHGIGFAFEAELATTLHAIEIANVKGWGDLLIECDSIYVIQMLRARGPNILWRLIPSWHKSRKLLQGRRVVVSHIYREGNATADRLTRELVHGFKWWSEPPDFLIPFLQRDNHSDFYRFSV